MNIEITSFKPRFIFYSFIYYFRKLLFYLAYKGYPLLDNDRYLISLKNKHKGRRAFIIGTGPSLKFEDINKLKNEITFACNKIYLSFDKVEWRPTYYFAIDEVLLKQNYKKINRLDEFKKFLPWTSNLWCRNSNNVCFYNFIWEKFYPDNPKFGFNPLKGFYFGSTVTYSMIQMAHYMGIKEIYLLGIDFDYNVPKEHERGDTAFKAEHSQNHFHPNYYEKEETSFPPNLHRHEKSFTTAERVYVDSDGSIYNATRGGKLEIFPRVEFESLFK